MTDASAESGWVRAHALELLLRLPAGLVRQLLGGDQVAVALDLLVDVVGVAELLLDLLELLAQQVLALRLVELPLDLRADLALHLQERDLVLEVLVDGPQALLDVDRFERLLGLLRFEVEVGGDEVREAGAVLERGGDEHDLRRDRLPELDRLLEVAADGPHERLELEVPGRRRGLLEAGDLGAQVRLLLQEVLDPGAGEALDEDPDAVVRQLDHPHDAGHGADLVEVLRLRVLVVGVLLGEQEQEAVLRQRLVHRGDRALAADRQRHHHEREEHRVLQRHRRQHVGDRDGLLAGVLDVFLGLVHGSSVVTAIVCRRVAPFGAASAARSRARRRRGPPCSPRAARARAGGPRPRRRRSRAPCGGSAGAPAARTPAASARRSAARAGAA